LNALGVNAGKAMPLFEVQSWAKRKRRNSRRQIGSRRGKAYRVRFFRKPKAKSLRDSTITLLTKYAVWVPLRLLFWRFRRSEKRGQGSRVSMDKNPGEGIFSAPLQSSTRLQEKIVGKMPTFQNKYPLSRVLLRDVAASQHEFR
jgi:hypothetical protein